MAPVAEQEISEIVFGRVRHAAISVAGIDITLVELEIFQAVLGLFDMGGEVVIFRQATTLVAVRFECPNIDATGQAGATAGALGAVHKAATAPETLADEQAIQWLGQINLWIWNQIGGKPV